MDPLVPTRRPVISDVALRKSTTWFEQFSWNIARHDDFS
jgi:hypothetical protein